MAFNSDLGYKTERLTADGQINSGRPIRKLVAVGAKAGGTAGLVEWHEAADASQAATKRGGLTVSANSWGWVAGLDQQLAQAFFNIDANITELVVIYAPHSS